MQARIEGAGDGAVMAIGWSSGGDLPEPGPAVKAAEAVDRAPRGLAGRRAEDPEAPAAP